MKIKILLILFSLFLCFRGANAQFGNDDLKHWPAGKSPMEIGKRVTIKFLNTPHSPSGTAKSGKPATKITYREVCTWLGGLWFAEATHNDSLLNCLEDRFTPLLGKEKYLQPIPNHVDNNVFGAVPLELYIQTKQNKYLDLGLKYADSQWKLPENASFRERLWADQGYSWQTRIWIDDMFMITAVQLQAYRATGDVKYMNRAAKEMVLYLDSIQLSDGLFYHSPEAHFCWARGNGWMAVGMAEMLRSLSKKSPQRDKIMTGYRKMMATLLLYQGTDGLWRQLIDDPEAWEETSGTAMFTYAMILGVKNGWLDKEVYSEAVRKAWLGLVSHVDENSELTWVCEGTGIKDNRDYYLARKRITGDLHGQAPLLWCAAALLNPEN